jgi:hypothetical protein
MSWWYIENKIFDKIPELFKNIAAQHQVERGDEEDSVGNEENVYPVPDLNKQW